MSADEPLKPNTSDELLDEFDRIWAANATASIGSYLAISPRGLTASELCLIDHEYRWKLSSAGQKFDDDLGGRPRLVDYCRAWPDLAEALSRDDCLANEYRVRRLWGDDPTLDQFLSEQPSPKPNLLDALRRVDAELSADDAAPNRVVAQSRARPEDDPRAPLLFSDFTLHELVGSGGMSKVYRATQRSLDREVAIKALLKSLQHDRRAVDRFVDEGRIAARLRHPNIVGVHGLGRFPGGGYFLALDFVAGANLAANIEAEPLTLHQAVEIVATVARAVDYAHAHGVIHCDLKPSNVLLDSDQTVHLTDFGLAHLTLGEAQHSRRLGGTLGFMAPELALNNRPQLTPAIDVYGLGALLFALLTRRPPVACRTWEEFVSSLKRIDLADELSLLLPNDKPLAELMVTMLAPSPGDRPTSAAAVADELDGHL